MPDNAERQDPIIRAIRRLTFAVWALTAVMAGFLAIYLIAYIPGLSPSFATVASTESVSPAAPPKVDPLYANNFYQWPVEKQIAAASVVALAKYQKDGDRTKCVVSEILKQAPDTKFYYNVGDEFPQCSHYPKAGEDRGDGQVVFFVGNPAQFRFSSAIRGNRISGLGDMPVDLLKKQIGESK